MIDDAAINELVRARNMMIWSQHAVNMCHENKYYDELPTHVAAWTNAVKHYNKVEREFLGRL